MLAVAHDVAQAIRLPVDELGLSLAVTASIGVALSRGRPGCGSALLREADAAMYRAKRSGRGHIALFDEALAARVSARLELETTLRRALETDALTIAYQPVVALDSGRPVGVEALLRWQDPGRGAVPPDEFIHVAEETGVIVQLGALVLRGAATAVAGWQQAFGLPLALSVNVSPRQLTQPHELLDAVRDPYAGGLLPGTLALEITESALLVDAEHTFGVLGELRNLGAQVYLDDFGTGYSSLARVKRFPLDALKIDRSFVDGARIRLPGHRDRHRHRHHGAQHGGLCDRGRHRDGGAPAPASRAGL